MQVEDTLACEDIKKMLKSECDEMLSSAAVASSSHGGGGGAATSGPHEASQHEPPPPPPRAPGEERRGEAGGPSNRRAAGGSFDETSKERSKVLVAGAKGENERPHPVNGEYMRTERKENGAHVYEKVPSADGSTEPGRSISLWRHNFRWMLGPSDEEGTNNFWFASRDTKGTASPAHDLREWDLYSPDASLGQPKPELTVCHFCHKCQVFHVAEGKCTCTSQWEKCEKCEECSATHGDVLLPFDAARLILSVPTRNIAVSESEKSCVDKIRTHPFEFRQCGCGKLRMRTGRGPWSEQWEGKPFPNIWKKLNKNHKYFNVGGRRGNVKAGPSQQKEEQRAHSVSSDHNCNVGRQGVSIDPTFHTTGGLGPFPSDTHNLAMHHVQNHGQRRSSSASPWTEVDPCEALNFEGDLDPEDVERLRASTPGWPHQTTVTSASEHESQRHSVLRDGAGNGAGAVARSAPGIHACENHTSSSEVGGQGPAREGVNQPILPTGSVGAGGGAVGSHTQAPAGTGASVSDMQQGNDTANTASSARELAHVQHQAQMQAVLEIWRPSDLILLAFYVQERHTIEENLKEQMQDDTEAQILLQDLKTFFLERCRGTRMTDAYRQEFQRMIEEIVIAEGLEVTDVNGDTKKLRSSVDVFDFTAMKHVFRHDITRRRWRIHKQSHNFDEGNAWEVVDGFFGAEPWTVQIITLIRQGSFGVFFQMQDTQQAHLALLLFEHHLGVQDQLLKLGYRYFAPFEQDDGTVLICGYNVGDIPGDFGKPSEEQRELIEFLSGRYHDGDAAGPGDGYAAKPKTVSAQAAGAKRTRDQEEQVEAGSAKKGRAAGADAAGAVASTAAPVAFQGAANPFASGASGAKRARDEEGQEEAGGSAKRSQGGKLDPARVKDAIAGAIRYTEIKTLLEEITKPGVVYDPSADRTDRGSLHRFLVGTTVRSKSTRSATRSAGRTRGRGGRGAQAAVEADAWADEMLQQLHRLPASGGDQEGLLQVMVRRHDDEDDDEGEAVPTAPLDPAEPAVRKYYQEYDVLVKTTIRNLGEHVVTLTPVYYCVKPAGEATERQEPVTLKSGEEAEMQFPVQLDESEGETETGWRFEDAAGAIVLRVRIFPPA